MRIAHELRRILLITGVVLIGLGLLALIAGAGLHADAVVAAADSDARFAGGVLLGYGLVWIHAARAAQLPATLIRLLAGGLLLGGLARVVSLFAVGQPDVLPTVQILVEIVIPTVVLVLLPKALRSPITDS